MSRKAQPWLWITLVSTAACQGDLPPIEYETAHLRIGLASGFEGKLCQGDLEAYERQVVRAEDVLGVTVGDPIELYLYPELAEPCDDPVLGCYDTRNDRVFANDLAWDHELVHAVAARRTSDVDPFFNEGVAEALELQPQAFPSVATLPSENLGLAESNLADYDTAAHFHRWVWSEFGPDALRALISEGGPYGVFESATGVHLSDAQETWLAESAWAYAGVEPCPGRLMESADGVGWAADLSLDCDDPEVRSRGDDAMALCRRVDLSSPGIYAFEASTFAVWQRCVVDDLDDPIASPGPNGVPTEFDMPQLRTVPDGGPVEFTLEAGSYQVCVIATGQEATDESWTLTRTGVVPEAP